MQKIIFGIFAHPDDEAFGPCGTLVKEVQSGTELHLVCMTGGEGGMNPDSHEDLGHVRLQEWRAAGELIGATSMQHLGYTDGTLNNLDHLEITDKITQIVKEKIDDRHDIEIEFVSLDLNGLTGHIDHIVTSRSACLAFYKLRSIGLPMNRIRLACLSSQDTPAINTDFVFMQPGRSDGEIDETIDACDQLDTIRQIMQCHHTQRSDAEAQIAALGDRVAVDHFLIMD